MPFPLCVPAGLDYIFVKTNEGPEEHHEEEGEHKEEADHKDKGKEDHEHAKDSTINFERVQVIKEPQMLGMQK